MEKDSLCEIERLLTELIQVSVKIAAMQAANMEKVNGYIPYNKSDFLDLLYGSKEEIEYEFYE